MPLRLTPGQLKLHAAIEKQRALKQPVRGVILKARQVHLSVGCAAEIFRHVAVLPGQRAFVVAHIHAAAQQIWGYYDQFVDAYREHPDAEPRMRRVTRRHQDELHDFDGGGFVRVATAENVRIGRAFSLRYLQLDEYAYWRDAESVMTGLMQCVPPDPDTMVLVPSTANGMGGPFYELWKAASDPAQDNGWFASFVAWWEHPKYALPVQGDRRRFEDSLTREELDLRGRYNLTAEQLTWRRWCITTNCEGSVERFHQEYPGCPEEAFLVSGRPRFCLVSLGRMPIIRDPISGSLEQVTVGTRTQIQFVAREDGRGELRVWKRPVAGHRYVIGADCAEGIDAAGEAIGRSDTDYSVAEVADADTGETVAVLRARLEPSIFGGYLADLGRWFNWAYLVPEANGPGIAVIEELLRQQYPLYLLYARKRTPDDTRGASLQEIGWKTTQVTKPQLVSALDRAIREQSIIIRDAVTLAECRSFVIDSRGRTQAQEGCHDDCVIALALAVVGMPFAPRPEPTPQQRVMPKPVSYRSKPARDEDGELIGARRW